MSAMGKKIWFAAVVIAALMMPGCAGETAPAGEQAAGTGEKAGADGTGGEGNSAEGSAAWSIKELVSADFLLYNVDCGRIGSSSFAEGEIQGLLQSVPDKEYGLDGETGRIWGYRPCDILISEEDSTGSGITEYKWYFDEEKDAGNSEAVIEYSFEVPDGDYRVTTGFYDPKGVRRVDVYCEEEKKVSQEKLLRFKLVETPFDTKVSDGELNIRVCNDDGKNFMDWPVLSYIKVEAVPEYSRDLISEYLKTVEEEDPYEVYTTGSAESFVNSLKEAEALLEREDISGEEIENAFENLRRDQRMLTKKTRYYSFRPGSVWKDTENTPIQAHGGQVQRLTYTDPVTGERVTKWVWVGEDKTNGYRGGVCAYTSDDLYNWESQGVIMRNVPSREALDTDEYFKEVYKGCTSEELDNTALCLDAEKAVIERPKLIYNEKNDRYVLWFHADGPTEKNDSNYAAACAGVAVSDSPFGPYKFIDRYRLNTCPADQEDFFPDSKGMARDMNLFTDVDGTAYIIYSSEENYTLYISKLNDDYTYLATAPEKAVYGKDFIRIMPGGHREAPAMFLKDGRYYLMTSGCTGWDPNQASYCVADSVLGEWTEKGDPCKGDDNHTTFDSQSTCIFNEPETDTWIYMGDRWFSDRLNDSRYLWLPLNFKDNGDMELTYTAEWTLE